MGPQERKDAIRRVVLSRRALLTPDERDARAAQLMERLAAVPEFASADPVLAFVSIGTEVPTGPVLRHVLDGGRVLLLPYVAEDGALRAAAVRSLDELEPGYRRIPEPRARFPVEPSTAGAIVTPGVAFDERGGRLGYGGGFYDGLLARAPGVPRIGICFEVQVVDEVPVAEHDERVDVVVTEARAIRAR